MDESVLSGWLSGCVVVRALIDDGDGECRKHEHLAFGGATYRRPTVAVMKMVQQYVCVGFALQKFAISLLKVPSEMPVLLT